MALGLTLLAANAACRRDSPPTPPATPTAASRATLQQISGAVSVKRAAGDDWSAALEAMPLWDNDKVRTGARASAQVRFASGSVLTLAEESLVGIAETRARPGQERTDVTVLRGTVDATLERPATQSLSVTTPSATVRAGREIIFQ